MSKAAASQVISLPSGGGAISGIGETFAPDLHTGTGNFSVPIALPSGRNGFHPELNLVYSTGNGNGPFGLGWSLSLPGVSRKTSKGVPRYDNARDTFLLSGAEHLIPVETHETHTRYQPHTEGLFARITRHHSAGQDYWEVGSRDGLVSFYGIPEAGADPAVVADPANRDHIFAWKLTRTLDTFGNQIAYDYERDAGQEGSRQWNQLYLKRIRYVDYADEASAEALFLISVTFDYGDPAEERPDAFSAYRAGFEIRTRRRCRRIVIATHAGEERVVRTYELRYLDERVAAGELSAALLPPNGVSLLSQVWVVGHDGDRAEALPTLEFGYTRFAPERRDFFPLAGRELPAQSLAAPDMELADLFGNGLPDIVQLNGTARYWRNQGGTFDVPRTMPDAPAGLSLADAGVQLLDADGDGRPDLLTTTDELAGYFPLGFDGRWDRRSFQRYRAAPSFNLEDPDVQLVDLDGDGVTDALRAGTRFECFFNDPEEGWNRTRQVERRHLAAFPNVGFADPRVKWADMSGDGLQDIVLIHDGNVVYWPNLGHGDWGGHIVMRNAPRFPLGYHPRRILVGDVDGDGLADLVYVDHGQVLLWINRSGDGWSEPIVIPGTPLVTDLDAVQLTDLLGSGIHGLLWSAAADGQGRSHMFFLDFTGGIKPYLLDVMDNHMGARTRVTYAPSTRFYLDDQADPAMRWRTPLPFPVQVVARVEVSDALSGGKRTTEYSYHHGYWDAEEREFRGFGRVDQRDSERFREDDPARPAPTTFAPPTETRTWFHQGPVGDAFGGWEEPDFSHEFWPGDPQRLERPASTSELLQSLPRHDQRDALRTLRGKTLRSELYALDGTELQGRPYTVTEYLCGVREEAPATGGDHDRRRIFFPHTRAQRTTQWERGDDPMTRFSFSDDYDAFGQPLRTTQIACPRGWRALSDAPGQPFLATDSRTVYARPVDPQVYIVNRVAKSTSYEIANDGGRPLLELLNLPDDSPALRLIGQTLNFYDGPAFEGRPFGEVGAHGAQVCGERLALSEEILRAAYKDGEDGPELPPFLVPDAAPHWPDEYPQPFRDRIDGLPGLASYRFYPDHAEHARGYFVAAERRRYDFQPDSDGEGQITVGRGLVLATLDPLGGQTKIAYDHFALLPVEVTDPAGLRTAAAYDERVLQPHQVDDPNGNRTRYSYTPLSLLQSIVVMGKEGEGEGDTNEAPGTRFEYGLLAFDESPPDDPRPVFVRTIRRVYHVNDGDTPERERDETIETREYSDGFGRLLQTRAQGEDARFGDGVFGGGAAILPADQAAGAGAALIGEENTDPARPNVVVSGWQVYDNKGRVVEKYEPFFAAGWDYDPPEERQLGQKARMFYDPRGQVIGTLNPDGSEQRVVFGVPHDLGDPELFAPTPWEAYSYDENDNAGRTHPEQASGYARHWNTPASSLVDAQGRTIETIERNGPEAADWLTTRSSYDIRGNLLAVSDPMGREAFRYVYDLLPAGQDEPGRVLRVEQLDAGIRRSVLDAAGNLLEQRDSKGTLMLQAHDALSRPTHLWARDAAGEPATLRERLVYGDDREAGLDEAAARAANLPGKLFKHYDEAGLLTFEHYDFKGNLLKQLRRVIADEAILAVFPAPGAAEWQVAPFRVGWQPPEGTAPEAHAETLLDPDEYRTSTGYDALDRIARMRYPSDAAGERKELRPQYNRAGALERVTLDGEIYVERIAYDAKGQRVLIALGNGVMTRYDYDARTFRLARLRSERYTQPDPLTYRPAGEARQDFAYTYDLAGNIIAIHDRTPGGGLPATPDQLDRAFSYDPLYRLLSATGRECERLPERAPWDDRPRCTDITRAQGYSEQYRYDAAGNLAELRHASDGQASVRRFGLVPGGDRLATMTIGQTSHRYTYDAGGNIVQENGARHFAWDHADRMKAFRSQVDAEEPSVYAHYLYDAGGQRVKKLVRKQGGRVEVTVYIGGVFEQHRVVQGATMQENTTLHVMDDQARIAQIRVGEPFPDDTTPDVKYHLGDHLGSSNVVVDQEGSLVSREEYTPYGETSFGSFARKRYRFTGKERDEESGLYYHGARYYAPWLGRWVSCDPAGGISGVNAYTYVRSRPTSLLDEDGQQDDETKATLEYVQKLADVIPQDEWANLTPGARGTRAHLTMESAITMGWEYDAQSGANLQRLAPEVQVNEKGIITAVGREPGAAGKGWRTIDIALLKQDVEPHVMGGKKGYSNLVGKPASEVIEAAIDYKTGKASLRRVTHMEKLIKAPYVPLRKGGNLAASVAKKTARLARAGIGAAKRALNQSSSGAKWIKRGVKYGGKAVPFAGAAVTYYTAKGSRLKRAIHAAAGEIGIGPVDLGLLFDAYDWLEGGPYGSAGPSEKEMGGYVPPASSGDQDLHTGSGRIPFR